MVELCLLKCVVEMKLKLAMSRGRRCKLAAKSGGGEDNLRAEQAKSLCRMAEGQLNGRASPHLLQQTRPSRF